MESTFSRSVGGPAIYNSTSTFDRDSYSKELNDAFKSMNAYNDLKQETTRHNALSSQTDVDY